MLGECVNVKLSELKLEEMLPKRVMIPPLIDDTLQLEMKLGLELSLTISPTRIDPDDKELTVMVEPVPLPVARTVWGLAKLDN